MPKGGGACSKTHICLNCNNFVPGSVRTCPKCGPRPLGDLVNPNPPQRGGGDNKRKRGGGNP